MSSACADGTIRERWPLSRVEPETAAVQGDLGTQSEHSGRKGPQRQVAALALLLRRRCTVAQAPDDPLTSATEIPRRCARRELPQMLSPAEQNVRGVGARGGWALGCWALRSAQSNFRSPRLCFHSLPPFTLGGKNPKYIRWPRFVIPHFFSFHPGFPNPQDRHRFY